MAAVTLQKKESLSKLAYERIKSMILQKELLPGQLVSETRLQEVLGLGRTPVREALLALAQNDLITVHPRKGIEITHPTPKAVHDVYELRIMMEPLILRRCFLKVDLKEMAALRDELLRCSEQVSSGGGQDELDLISLDNRFHLSIVDLPRNQYLSNMMRGLSDYLSLIRFVVWNAEEYLDSNATHIAILDAILARDVEESCRLLSQHLQNSYQEAIESMMRLDF